MKITLKDYTTDETILTMPVELIRLDGRSVFITDDQKTPFDDELEIAIYAVNNDVHSGVLADNWSDDYETPINPYMTWVFED
jgi:hypothetical protein